MTKTVERRHAGLAAYAGFVAFSAYAGAVGLATGVLDPKGTLDERLPFDSPVFGGAALALIVGVPTTVVAFSAWRGSRNLGRALIVAGVMLIGWIAVELAWIRELSWLQFFYVGVGASFIALGAADRRLAGTARHL